MRFNVVTDPAALADLRGLRAHDRRAVLDVMERILTTAPTRVSKSRNKRLRGLDTPQYRLRVGDAFRVFYDVTGTEVYILRVLTKAAVAEYLAEMLHETEDRDRGATGPGDGQGAE